jgi:sialate O-acetylesterase
MRFSLLLPVLGVFMQGVFSVGFAAEFRLGSPFCDHMVLQREKPVAIWGWAEAGEEVTVRFADQQKSATAALDGRWRVQLDPLPASSEPRALSVSGRLGQQKAIEDVLVGEVWLGSGQSNMAMTVAEAQGFETEKAAANLPLIRYYREASGPALEPQAAGKGMWQACSPETVGTFSATLYFFGHKIHSELGVPVGLINTSVGGTVIESWLSAQTQQADPEMRRSYETSLKQFQEFDPATSNQLWDKQKAVWKAAAEKAKANNAHIPPPPKNPLAMYKLKGGPAGLYNGKVFNLAPYTLRGLVWYQGEGNAKNPETAALYSRQLSALVTSWRALWQEELPFAWVQLPNYRNSPQEGWPRMRESMARALELPKTGMAVTVDLGDPTNIHPTRKKEVGQRLALWALGSVYGRPVPAICGPLLKSHKVEKSSVILSFQHAETGLKTRDGGPVLGFQLAGADRNWKPALARIEGDKVVVGSPEVPNPVAVRHAWAENPVCNLINGAGLPASTFRTDDWPAQPLP